MRYFTMMIAMVMGFPAATLAEGMDPVVCGIDFGYIEDRDELLGDYILVVGPGTLAMGAMVMPFPQSGPLDVVMFRQGGVLGLAGDSGKLQLDLLAADDAGPMWEDILGVDPEHMLSAAALSLAVCETADEPVPVVTGTGTWISADNRTAAAQMSMGVHGYAEDGRIYGLGGMVSTVDGFVLSVRFELTPK